MKKYFILFLILVLCFRAESTIIPLTGNSSFEPTITKPVAPAFNIATAKAKDIEKLLGRKLKLKERIAIKVFQWKYKKAVKAKKEVPAEKKGKTAMILGIIGIATLFIPYLVIASIPCAILAIIIGNKAKKADPSDGQAKAGVILGWVTLGVFVIALIVAIALISAWTWG